MMTITLRDMDHEWTDTVAHSNEVSTNLSTLPHRFVWRVVTPEKKNLLEQNLPIGKVCNFPAERQVFVTLWDVKVWQSCAAMNS